MEPPMDLVTSILRATSGNPCRAAEERLPDLVDGLLDEVDAELVRGHLHTCPPCTALAQALARIAETLPAMQETDPGRSFTAAVIARTSRSRRARLAASWRALVLRPAFAMQGAYVGALVVFGLFGLPGSPLRELPRSAAHAVVATAGQVEEETSTAVQGAEKRAERIAAQVREMKRSFERRIDETLDSMTKKNEKEKS